MTDGPWVYKIKNKCVSLTLENSTYVSVDHVQILSAEPVLVEIWEKWLENQAWTHVRLSQRMGDIGKKLEQ